MGYKNVCLNCRKAFNQGTDFKNIREADCPECGKKMVQVDQKFKPPKKTEIKKWETVKFLIENGFKYQRIYETDEMKTPYVQYPENIKEAKEFVLIYGKQAYKE